MVDPGKYLTSWSTDGGFWSRVSSKTGIPGIKFGKLLAAIFGGIGLAWTYWIIGPVRRAAVWYGQAIQDGEASVQSLITKVTEIPREPFLTAAARSSAAVGSEGVLGFALAFGVAGSMAMIIWFAWRVVR